MTKEEQQLIQAFVQNTQQFEAVKKALMQDIVEEGDWARRVSRDQPLNEYGEQVKVIAEALDRVEEAINRLKQYDKQSSQNNSENIAR